MPDVADAASISIQAEGPTPSDSRQVPVTPAPTSTAGAAIPATPAPKRATGIRDVPEDTPSAAQGYQFSEAQLGALAAVLQGTRAAGGAQEGQSPQYARRYAMLRRFPQMQTSQIFSPRRLSRRSSSPTPPSSAVYSPSSPRTFPSPHHRRLKNCTTSSRRRNGSKLCVRLMRRCALGDWQG